MSASRRPTVAPLLRSAAARLTATVDLPTPPLPDATAIVCFTPGRISEGLGRMKAGRTLAVIRTSTPVTPGSSLTASSACDLNRSRTGHAGVVSSKVKLTLPCGLTSSSLIMPRLTTSRPRSGSLMCPSASRTCCEEGAFIGCDLTEAWQLKSARLISSVRHETGDGRQPGLGADRLLRRPGLRRLFPESPEDAGRGACRRGGGDGFLRQPGRHPVWRRRGDTAARRDSPERR